MGQLLNTGRREGEVATGSSEDATTTTTKQPEEGQGTPTIIDHSPPPKRTRSFPPRHTYPSSPLYTFIRRDINPKPEGQRILLPFLTTWDLLRLSECSRGLIKYRTHLSRLKISPHPHPSPNMTRGLARLLLEQESGPGAGVNYLCLADLSMLKLLEDLAAMGWCDSLQTLDLSGLEMQDQHADCFARIISGGGLKTLKELKLQGSVCHVTLTGLISIMGALAQGGCPELLQLDISENRPLCEMEGAEDAIATALGSGKLSKLRQLYMSSTQLKEEPGLIAIARVLEEGNCPELRELVLSDYGMFMNEANALASALRSGSFSHLEILDLSGNVDGPALAMALEALETKCCPNIRKLDLNTTTMEATDNTNPLTRILLNRALPKLETLDMGSRRGDGPVPSQVAGAIKQGVCPNLRFIDMSDNLLIKEDGKALAEALLSMHCTKLEELYLGKNPDLGDEGLLHIVQALQSNCCPKLKRLHLNGIGMGPKGAAALTTALSSSALPCLQRLDFDSNPDLDSTALAEVIRAMGRGCPDLRVFRLVDDEGLGDEGGRALAEVFKAGQWA